MNYFLSTWAFINIAYKRLIAQWGLALVTMVGLIASISLVLSIPLYADAIYRNLFIDQINQDESGTGQINYPPLTILLSYYGGENKQLQWGDIQPLNHYLTQSARSILGIPLNILVHYYESSSGDIFPIETQELTYDSSRQPLEQARFGTMNDLEGHISIVEGSLPEPSNDNQNIPIDVLVSQSFANQMGFQTGERYLLVMQNRSPGGIQKPLQIPFRIAGFWQVTDPDDPYWMFSPSSFNKDLLVPESTYINQLSPILFGEINNASWYLVIDSSRVHANQVGQLVHRITRIQNQVNNLLPNIIYLRTPIEILLKYQRSAFFLTILLYSFATPIIGLILAFISLVGSLSTERRRHEIAISRSRGASSYQILGSILLENVILGLVSLGIGIPLAVYIASFISQTSSFMKLSGGKGLQVTPSVATVQIGLVVFIFTLVVVITPTISAVRNTIITYKRERARRSLPPWWQRYWIDVLLLIPVIYGAFILNQQGSISVLGSTSSEDPLNNPLLILVPSLAFLAVSLIVLRLIPLLMAAISWIISHTRNSGLILATRQLARSPNSYSTPLLILIFTLGLSAYTASLARTLDQNTNDNAYYRVGSDVIYLEVGEWKPGTNQSVENLDQPTGSHYNFFPVSEYLKIPGVKAVTRVGVYPATGIMNQGNFIKARFYGIDRTDFPGVAFWRRDFASLSLGALMNSLGSTPDGILTPVSLMRQYGLQYGDPLRIRVDTSEAPVDVNFKIVGTFNLFPTWYPADDGPLFVANLDYLYEQAGGEYPYYVWLKTSPELNFSDLGEVKLPDLYIKVISWDAAPLYIQKEIKRPEHQGIFGILFLGFTTTAILTAISFFLYEYFSYRRRFIEFGILRAGGLSRSQMITYLTFELFSLIFLGGAIGTGFGVGMSSYFIPFTQVGKDIASITPPFQVIIAWHDIFKIYLLFGVLFFITLILLAFMLQRLKIFQAIKLGEIV